MITSSSERQKKGETDTETNNDEKLKELMKIEYNYPDVTDEDFQEKIFKKREYYYHRVPERPEVKEYRQIQEYRANICTREPELFEQQLFLSNYVNPDTDYRGVIVFHGTGTGKCLLGSEMVFINGESMKIENLWKFYNSGKFVKDNEGGLWSMPTEELIVNSISDDGVIVENKVKHLYRQFVNEMMRKIVLKNGFVINITMAHKLLVKDIGWVANFDVGNYIFLPNYLIGVDHQEVIDYILKIGYVSDEWLVIDDDVGDVYEIMHMLISIGIRGVVDDGSIYVLVNEFEKVRDEAGYWVRVEDIVFFPHSGYVYDLEVKGDHNFVCNGIFVSNTCGGIAIGEKFKPLVQKYDTKIHVLVSGPLMKEIWKRELLKCTGETYMRHQDLSVYTNDAEKQKIRKNAINNALQYYRLMSYRSFYKKVLGEKIQDKVKGKDNKVKIIYRKTEKGEFERDIAVDRIYNLNNSLIIVDEAHNLTMNSYGEALMKIIRASHNLKVVLLTAIPMKNLADDIVELVNFLRPENDLIERDKIFNSYKNHMMDFKANGLQYLKNMTRGYVSYLRGADPLTFAKRIEKGVVPPGLLFTKVVRCKMLPFQRKAYDEALNVSDDTLDRRSQAVANFAFPGLNANKKQIVGFYGNDALVVLKGQIKSNYELLNKKIANELFGDENYEGDMDLLTLSDDGKTVSGGILKINYLKNFSIKFYKAYKKVSRLVVGKKGARTAFIYSNLVKVGIEMFQQILLVNGYLEYDDNRGYKIKPWTRCYYCGRVFKEHKTETGSESDDKSDDATQRMSESSTEYKKEKSGIPQHVFYPATFVVVTGKSSEEAADVIPEEKQKILDNVFSNIENIHGKYIKFVLGSKVMQEGISLQNVAEVHILDVYFNLGKIDQVIGRAIRHCSHYSIMSEDNPYPSVNVYKYAVMIEEGLSTEEDLYKKAELKYILIKKVERALKENAIDCPLNRSKNMFPEELELYKGCVPPNEVKEGDKMCPLLCDYMDCNFRCDSKLLNERYFDPVDNVYKRVVKKDIDYSTFTQNLARNEIQNTKTKIKEMYRLNFYYTLKDFVNYVRESYEGEKKELFDEFFVFKALDELTPITENDFNNFKDTIYDKYNRQGYLIYVDEYYIFQPFDQNENVPIYYRSEYDEPMRSQLTLYNYLKNIEKLPIESDEEGKGNEDIVKKGYKDKKSVEIGFDKPLLVYDFDSVMEYYDGRDEFKVVGIIDKESSRRKTKSIDELADVFKIRGKIDKIIGKKRGIGIYSTKGAVCASSKTKASLEETAKELKIKIGSSVSREKVCEEIKNKLLFLEKYSTNDKKNKMTYLIIPKNHPLYSFPYNLEDRVKYIMDQIKEKIKIKFDHNIIKNKVVVNGQDVFTYTIEIINGPHLKEFSDVFVSLGATQKSGKWLVNVN